MSSPMNDDLLGYALNALDDDERRGVELRLDADPQAQERLDLLRAALAPLAADNAAPNPPPHLVANTIALAAEHMCRPLPSAPRPVAPAPVFERPWWRRADVLVAAALLVAVVGLAGPALVQSHRARHMTVLCQNNLMSLFVALEDYHSKNEKTYPNLDKVKPHNAAGMLLPILRDAHLLPPGKPIGCPGNPLKPCGLPLELLRDMNLDEFLVHAPVLNPSYAYDLGYCDESGYHPAGRREAGLRALTPLLADAPAGPNGNSLNHGGAGQNVLFQDGHVKFVKTRTVGYGGDDIFINRDGQVKAGKDRDDWVLGDSAAKP